MHDFKVGDRVVRTGRPWQGILPGDVGTVVQSKPGDLRVRYDRVRSAALDMAYGQIETNVHPYMERFPNGFFPPGWKSTDPEPVPLEELLIPKPQLGPDIGMFIRDGMSPARARLVLANREAQKGGRVATFKIRAALPGVRTYTVHKAPRHIGGLAPILGWHGK